MPLDPLKPSPALLYKLASIAVHADEMTSPSGHEFDKVALDSALHDADVEEWIVAMTNLGMAPAKR